MSDQHVRRLKWKPLHFLKEDGVADSLTKANASAAGYQSVMFEKLTTLTIVDSFVMNRNSRTGPFLPCSPTPKRKIPTIVNFSCFDSSRQLSQQQKTLPVLFILTDFSFVRFIRKNAHVVSAVLPAKYLLLFSFPLGVI